MDEALSAIDVNDQPDRFGTGQPSKLESFLAVARAAHEERIRAWGRRFELEAAQNGPHAPREARPDLQEEIAIRNQLERQILSACCEQRRKIGRELHDDLGQRLTAVAFLAASLARDLARTNSPKAKDAFKMERLLGDAVSQIRLLARGLFPAALEDGGLLGALERLAADARATYRIECRVLWHASASSEDPSVALHLYRICQEALNNAVKHGKASRVTIELFCDETKIAATIADNGVGFDARKARRGQGTGLRTMRHRCKVMGLGFRIARIQDGGTIVSIGD